MITSFGRERHQAKKEHTCDLCGKIINIGELYSSEFCVDDGYSFTFKTHMSCQTISDEIYEYVDPEDGMGKYEFLTGAEEVCDEFICPDCEKHGTSDCCYLCLDKLNSFFSDHELYREKVDGRIVWKVRSKELPF